MTDPIADLLTRLRNAQSAGHESTTIPHSMLKESLLRVICKEGFVNSFQVIGEGVKKQLVVSLKYTLDREPVITGLKRVSKPGLRVYRGFNKLSDVVPGMGTVILSTPKGLMTGKQARESKVGGEVLCQLW